MSRPPAVTAMARTTGSALLLPRSATISCAAPSAGRKTAGGKNEIRNLLRAAAAAALGTGQRADLVPQRARPARAGRPPRLRLRLGSRAPFPRGIFALAGPGGVPCRGQPAHPADPPRARHHAADDGPP